MPRLLAIGASDTSGASGLALAAKVAAVSGVEANPVVTAAVARSLEGRVLAVCALPPSSVRRQIDAACRDQAPGAVLIGCLPRHQTAAAVIERVKRRELARLVLFLSVSRQRDRALSTPQGLKLVRTKLLPLVELLVADLDAARAMLCEPDADVSGAAMKITEAGAKWALVSDDSGPASRALLWQTGQNCPAAEVEVEEGGIEALAALAACRMAIGDDVREAVRAH